mmetsp:Transcript_38372/g.57471  ORF Transcript_38372/g.57471 Transcript_38372/m.57471 type:complete len:220 (-) Transcript_38372:1431-2090(-)
MFACRIAAKEGISALTTRQVSIKRIPQSGSLFRIQVIRQFSTPSTIPQPHECSGNATGAQKRSLEKTRQSARSFQTWQPEHTCDLVDPSKPGSRAFADCEYEPLTDLFNQFAKTDHGGKVGGVDSAGTYLCLEGVRRLLTSIGERPDDETLRELFRVVDVSGDEKLHLEVSNYINKSNLLAIDIRNEIRLAHHPENHSCEERGMEYAFDFLYSFYFIGS